MNSEHAAGRCGASGIFGQGEHTLHCSELEDEDGHERHQDHCGDGQDALDEDEYEELANLLDRDLGKIRAWIDQRGAGTYTYWVCGRISPEAAPE